MIKKEQNSPLPPADGERICKVIARAGICSRRAAEELVAQRRVTCNGKTVEAPSLRVTPDDVVSIDGEPLPKAEKTELWLFHKPIGVITTHNDPQGRQTIFDVLPKDLPFLMTVGRLDVNSEGLLLLTNDGKLSRALELPSTGWKRRYKVRAHGRVDHRKISQLEQGATIEGIHYAPAKIELEESGQSKTNHWFTITITEGKNREIRNMLAWAGLKVNRLIRTAYGPFQLGKLRRGEIKKVSGKVVQEQLGSLLK